MVIMELADRTVHIVSLLLVVFSLVPRTVSWGSDGDKILLNDIKVLTLYHGRSTNARRSSPIPQLKCVGGTAGCNMFIPQVVQCYNRGTDGYDVQWECQTDMDNAYRFGQVTVSCEGFDYPDDPYVLKGSCGLEYTLDLTKEGHAQHQHGQQHSYYGDHESHGAGGHHGYHYTKVHGHGSSWLSNLLTLAVFCIVIYALYATCLSNAGQASSGEPGGSFRGSTRGFGSAPPPPPGFRDEYMPGGGCSSTYDSSYTRTGAGSNLGGFWTGAATGGLLGYMFGARNTAGYARPYGSTWGAGPGLFGGATRGGTTFGSAPSTGTRTASGFGGTKRR